MPLDEQIMIESAKADLAWVFGRVEHVSMHAKNFSLDHALIVDLMEERRALCAVVAIRWRQAEISIAESVEVRLGLLDCEYNEFFGAGL